MATTGCRSRQPIEHRFAVGGIAKSRRLAVRVKRPGSPDERSGDDTAKADTLERQIERDCVHPILLVDRNDVFVRGNLKHAVGRGIDDGLSRAHVLGAELLDDLRPRRRVVAERARGRCAARTRR